MHCWRSNFKAIFRFVLAVCIDRLYGIKSPLYSCREWSSRRMGLVLIGICIGTAVLTSYYHFAYDCVQIDSCNGTQLHSVCLSVAAEKWFKNRTNPHPYWMRSYIHIGTVGFVNDLCDFLTLKMGAIFTPFKIWNSIDKKDVMIQAVDCFWCDSNVEYN